MNQVDFFNQPCNNLPSNIAFKLFLFLLHQIYLYHKGIFTNCSPALQLIKTWFHSPAAQKTDVLDVFGRLSDLNCFSLSTRGRRRYAPESNFIKLSMKTLCSVKNIQIMRIFHKNMFYFH